MFKFSIHNTVVMLVILLLASSVTAADHKVKYPSMIENYHWTRGCSPTAAAITLSYWDYYNGGKYIHFGRLIDYYQSPDGTNNVPNLLHELADSMRTSSDGGTSRSNVSPGIEKVANDKNFYNFDARTRNFSSCGDDCWTDVQDEINGNRPFIWHLSGNPSGHSTAAWGYRDDRYVILYNTWDWNPQLPYTQYREDWYYRSLYNGSYGKGVTRIVPGNWIDSPSDILLDDPCGGERVNAGTTHRIQWYQFGTGITHVTIQYSLNNGRNWNTIVNNHPSSGEGWRSYNWSVPCTSSGTARVRIYGIKFVWIIPLVLAGDGSFDEFTIVRQTLSAPSGVRASSSSVCAGGSYTVSWSRVTGASGYEVEQNGSWTNVGNVTSKTFYPGSAGSYSHRVRAKNACSTGSSSSRVYIEVDSRPGSAPGNLHVSKDTVFLNESFTISWNDVANTTYYELCENGSWRQIGATSAYTYQLSDSGLYNFKVRPRNGCGSGPESQTVSVFVKNQELATDINVSPNPFVPSRGHDLITFFGQKAQKARVDIYDKAGRFVTSLENESNLSEIEWKPVNEDGRTLASGVYIWVAEDSRGEITRGKFAVIK